MHLAEIQNIRTSLAAFAQRKAARAFVHAASRAFDTISSLTCFQCRRGQGNQGAHARTNRSQHPLACAVEAGANAKPAELVRTYSSGGSVSTLKKEWTFAVESREAIPLDTLRPYLAADAVDKAIRAFVKAGGRQLAGVKIYEAPKAMVR